MDGRVQRGEGVVLPLVFGRHGQMQDCCEKAVEPAYCGEESEPN